MAVTGIIVHPGVDSGLDRVRGAGSGEDRARLARLEVQAPVLVRVQGDSADPGQAVSAAATAALAAVVERAAVAEDATAVDQTEDIFITM